MRNTALGQPIEPAIYFPATQFAFRAVFVAIAARDAETAKLRTDLARATTDRDDAVAKNAQFATLFSDLMTRYRNVGVAEVLRRAEPFTGLERSRVEGLLEEYRDRSDALRVGTEGATR